MIAEPQKSGIFGELFASRFLRNNGYEILCSNYRAKGGEIDLIVRKDGVVSFVEVKTRNADSFFSPSDAVDVQKELNIKNTAAFFLSQSKIVADVTYDIVEVILDKEKYAIKHTINAF